MCWAPQSAAAMPTQSTQRSLLPCTLASCHQAALQASTKALESQESKLLAEVRLRLWVWLWLVCGCGCGCRWACMVDCAWCTLYVTSMCAPTAACTGVPGSKTIKPSPHLSFPGRHPGGSTKQPDFSGARSCRQCRAPQPTGPAAGMRCPHPSWAAGTCCPAHQGVMPY